MRLLKTVSIIIFYFVINTLLTGCNNIILMHPKGNVGLQERSLILIALTLMLIVVIPAITMTIIFAVKYRSSNTHNNYNPNWTNNHKIEITIWSIPIIIITILATLTWKSTHTLDPQKKITSTLDPITIQVIALDWKWLFIYPKENIATINEIVFPINTPLQFNITSNSVMNAFFIPQLGSQIYAMAGMHTILHLIANQPGIYKGISSNFSGYGFSGMKFNAIATKNIEEFKEWVQMIHLSHKKLNNMEFYEKLARPTENHPVEYFSEVKVNLFNDVINKFAHST
ncbi:ubiquinol oxidase subunit II [Blochmannia endosymbiont of Polyrhachis (Hedomyrma) turneri]|uniref:ubiquinol oxidase subunit II n=1 Tax=Blochmannia endosymbiont of Polyrhachis (Hedomyrma) turneri TaxID=1505596 RepID=UPI00061B077D